MAEICLEYLPLGTGAGDLNDTTLPVTFVPNVYVNTDAFLFGHLDGIDDEFADIYAGALVKTGAVPPNGIVTPDFIGQLFVETATPTFWIAEGLANTDWVQIAAGVAPSEAIVTGIVSPVGAVVPAFIGQRYIDTALGVVWVAYGLLNTNWGLLVKRVTGGYVVGEAGDIAGGTGNGIFVGNQATNTIINSPSYSVIIGGSSNVIDGADNAVAMGQTNSVTQDNGIAIGTGGNVYKGSGKDQAVALGAGGKAYGGRGFALGGSMWGDRSIALLSGAANSIGGHSFACGELDGGTDTDVSGDDAAGFGAGVQVHGFAAFGVGQTIKIGTVATKAVTITNVGANVELVVAGEDLTSRIIPGDVLVIYDFSGGGFDPDVNANVITGEVVGAIAFGGGDTTITINGLNIAPATDGRVAFPEQANYSVAFGKDVVVNTGSILSFAMGDTTETEGPYQFAFGFQCNAGVTVADEGAVAMGYQAKAFNPYAQAFGRNSQTRNRGEHTHAGFQFSGTSWAQRRELTLGVQIPIATATDLLTTDGTSGGELPATFAGHGYTLTGIIQAVLSTGGAARAHASWLVSATYKNVGGVLTNTSLTLTLQLNEMPTKAIAPTFGVSGTNIAITCAKDQTNANTITWFADLVLSESGI